MIPESLPELAAEELTKLLAYSHAKSGVAAPVAQVVVITPTEKCAQDWKDLGATAFQKKYMTNQNGRAVYEQALSEGKI